MLGEATRDRRSERREATKAEILEAAWELVRAEGLAALSLRDLARKVGMQAPSLYGYFDSKNAIYDAMFAQGCQELLGRVKALKPRPDPVANVRENARLFIGFCVEDPARYQLLFQRTIPGFEPSPEAYAIAVEIVERSRTRLTAVGATRPGDMDLWTAVTGGIAAQQTANEPGGTRWTRLVDDAVDMYLAHIHKTRKKR